MFNEKKFTEMDRLTVPTKIIPTRQPLAGTKDLELDDQEDGLGYTHTLVSEQTRY